jgi:large subunit ribosomal protein L18
MPKVSSNLARKRRHARIRVHVKGTAGKPRLCVFRSLDNIYAQIIDDSAGTTLIAASSLATEIKEQMSGKNKTQIAERVGDLLAKSAMEKGIGQVVFDRGGYKYHGRIKALAEAANESSNKGIFTRTKNRCQ